MVIKLNSCNKILYKWGSYKNSNYMLKQLSAYRYFKSDKFIGYAQSAGNCPIMLRNPYAAYGGGGIV
jgi:hypothetical protein